jgi:hypothetical protein
MGKGKKGQGPKPQVDGDEPSSDKQRTEPTPVVEDTIEESKVTQVEAEQTQKLKSASAAASAKSEATEEEEKVVE